MESLREVFNKFDTDKSGFLEVNEVQAALAELGKPVNSSVISMVMRLKGISPGVSFEDFIGFFANIAFA